jgi:hypothetical protein
MLTAKRESRIVSSEWLQPKKMRGKNGMEMNFGKIRKSG